jgi:tetratricopeptide (TPR) repeat protein
MRKGLYAEAIPALQKAVRASPWLGQARRALADAYCKVGRFAEARDLAAELLKGDPTNRKLLMTLGLALLGLGEKEKAIEQFQSALSIDPDYEPALEALGKAQ